MRPATRAALRETANRSQPWASASTRTSSATSATLRPGRRVEPPYPGWSGIGDTCAISPPPVHRLDLLRPPPSGARRTVVRDYREPVSRPVEAVAQNSSIDLHRLIRDHRAIQHHAADGDEDRHRLLAVLHPQRCKPHRRVGEFRPRSGGSPYQPEVTSALRRPQPGCVKSPGRRGHPAGLESAR